MPQFLLLIREDLSRYPIPDAEMQKLVQAHTQWARELSARSIFIDGWGVGAEGKLLEMQGEQIAVLPIKDKKEGIGGIYIIEVNDLDAAISIAKECPTYRDGDKVEVRPLM
jgi:hypothetical protein